MKYLAIALSEKEFYAEQRLLAERLGKQDSALLLCHSFIPPHESSQNIAIIASEKFLSDDEIGAITQKAGFFAMNWYRFDEEFEKETTFNNISLGFLNEHESFNFFYSAMLLLKAILKAIESAAPAKIIADRNSIAGKCVSAIAASKKMLGVEFFELPAEKSFSHFSSISMTKAREMKGQLPNIVRELFKFEKKGRGKTIFIRSRGYLGKLKKELRKDSALNVISLDEFLLKKMLNPIGMHEYISTRLRMQKEFREIFAKLMAKREFREKLVFEGINLSEVFETQVSRITDRDWSEFVFLIEKLSEFFQKAKPSLTILWDDVIPFERICTMLARQSNGKSLVIQHGALIGVPEKGSWILGFAPLTTDIIAVWGEQAKESMVNHRVAAERVVVTGAPRFDALHNMKFNREAFRKELGISADEKLVLFATEILYLNKKIVKRIVEWLGDYAQKRKIRFAVKLRHIESVSDYKRAIGGQAIVSRDIDLYSLINAADAVIAVTSTVGIEAMILGKPFIAFGEKLPADCLYRATNAVLRAGNESALKQALNFALDEKNKKLLEKRMQEFVHYAAFRQDGKSTERVIGLIKNMV